MIYNPAFRQNALRKQEKEAREREMKERLRQEQSRARAAFLSIPRDRKITVLEVIAAVAAKHGLTSDDIIGRSRKLNVLAARKEAMRMAHSLRPDLSSPQLGRIFKRDHTTILYILGKINKPWKR